MPTYRTYPKCYSDPVKNLFQSMFIGFTPKTTISSVAGFAVNATSFHRPRHLQSQTDDELRVQSVAPSRDPCHDCPGTRPGANASPAIATNRGIEGDYRCARDDQAGPRPKSRASSGVYRSRHPTPKRRRRCDRRYSASAVTGAFGERPDHIQTGERGTPGAEASTARRKTQTVVCPPQLFAVLLWVRSAHHRVERWSIWSGAILRIRAIACRSKRQAALLQSLVG